MKKAITEVAKAITEVAKAITAITSVVLIAGLFVIGWPSMPKPNEHVRISGGVEKTKDLVMPLSITINANNVNVYVISEEAP